MIDLTPHAQVTHWSGPYVGRAWLPTFNCWHLVLAVLREVFGHELPGLAIGAEPTPENWQALRTLMDGSLLRSVAGDAIAQAQDGDILLMVGPEGTHVGVVTGKSLLHNLGGLVDVKVKGQVVDRKPQGSVRIDPLADLGRLGYGHFSLWRAA